MMLYLGIALVAFWFGYFVASRLGALKDAGGDDEDWRNPF